MDLRLDNLSKTYSNGVRALDNVSLTIPPGMYGLLGPNGAGKSTLMRILATLLDADSGAALLGDTDMLCDKLAVRRVLGYLPQEFGVYPRVSAIEMLDHLAVLKGILNRKQRREMCASLLNFVNLYPHRNKALTGFSGGMRQRFGIAQALLGSPQLLIVDEPTAGLDPGERNRFYNLVAEIGESVIVILSTHIVQDVRELCANMAILHQGRVLYAGSPEDAMTAIAGRIWRKPIVKAEMAEHQQTFRIVSTKMVAGRPYIHVFSVEPPGDGFQPVEPDLEDVFFSRILGLE
jgi:ABC-type multidrug transport system ATPase subunit